jgi:hypothetical protein
MKTPAFANTNENIRQYPVAAAQTFVEGALVLLNASGAIAECGADPVAVLGVAAHDAGVNPDPTLQLVSVADGDSTFFMSGSRAMTQADVGDSYGVAKDADGIWHIDFTEVTVKQIVIEKVDITRALAEVRFLAAARQLAA